MLKTHRIHGSIGASNPVLDDLQNASRPAPLQRLGKVVLSADLRQVEGITENVNDVSGRASKSFLLLPTQYRRRKFADSSMVFL